MSMPATLERRTIAALDVVELPPPTPSSCRGSPDPKADVSSASRLSASVSSGSTSTPLNSQHLLVPPRIQVARRVIIIGRPFRTVVNGSDSTVVARGMKDNHE